MLTNLWIGIAQSDNQGGHRLSRGWLDPAKGNGGALADLGVGTSGSGEENRHCYRPYLPKGLTGPSPDLRLGVAERSD
jgi:hypothetical protein